VSADFVYVSFNSKHEGFLDLARYFFAAFVLQMSGASSLFLIEKVFLEAINFTLTKSNPDFRH